MDHNKILLGHFSKKKKKKRLLGQKNINSSKDFYDLNTDTHKHTKNYSEKVF